MDLSNIIQKINDDENNVNRVLQYATIVNHLTKIRNNIGFDKTGDKLIDTVNYELNEGVKNMISNGIDKIMQWLTFEVKKD